MSSTLLNETFPTSFPCVCLGSGHDRRSSAAAGSHQEAAQGRRGPAPETDAGEVRCSYCGRRPVAAASCPSLH